MLNFIYYREEITDLIGVRVLHVFKQEWYRIHNFIQSKWDLKIPKPIVYHKKGDNTDFVNECEARGCTTKEHPKGYRSIHYIIQAGTFKEPIFAEIQVRTIFEEGWSEIDHKIRYSLKKETAHPLEDYLMILNGIAASADEFGKLIKRNQAEIGKKIYDEKQHSAAKKKGGKNSNA